MRFGTLWKMLGGRNAPSTFRAVKLLTETQRSAWLAAASKFGVLAALRDAPLAFDVLATNLLSSTDHEPGFRAWLRQGVLLGEIRQRDDLYALRSALAKRAAEDDGFAALLEGTISVHAEGLYRGMERWTAGETLRLSDVDAPTVARIGMTLAPVIRELIDTHVPAEGEHRLLEVGCGNGHNLRYAAERNPAASTHGLDLDEAVAAQARRESEAAGLSERVSIRAGDVRDAALPEAVDTILLANLLYYLPVDDRAPVLRRLCAALAPGGRLLVAGYCSGGGIGSNILDVWFSSMPETGPLPSVDGITNALETAGLTIERTTRLIPGDAYMLVVGRLGF